jgi:hypothetical protein
MPRFPVSLYRLADVASTWLTEQADACIAAASTLHLRTSLLRIRFPLPRIADVAHTWLAQEADAGVAAAPTLHLCFSFSLHRLADVART